MKKLFFFAMVALGMTAACQKPDVKVENPDLDDNAPVEVKFGVNAPSITVTKTKAAVDDWGDQTVYVYGFDKTLSSLANDNDGKSPMLINGEPATVTDQTTLPDDDPAASDVSALKFGNHASSEEKKFYYEVDAVYDFVGYYTGNQETVTPNGLNLTAEVVIDGSNDVMLAYANPTEDIDKANINMAESRVYSAFAARRNVHPTLNFKHMLTRFSFNIVEGETPNTTTSKDVNVTEIAIETTNKGTLTIAPISAQAFKKADNATATLTVKDIPAEGQTPNEHITPIGEDLMIFPGDKTVSFYVSLTPNAGTDPNLTGITLAPLKVDLVASEINKDGTETFKAGTKYTVTLTIYDLEQVSVSASLSEWDSEDEVTYDPDDKYASDITVTEVKVTNDSTNEQISLYHNAKTFKDGVAVFTDDKLTQKATAGNYTVDADNSTFTVTAEGLVSNYTPATQPGA